MNISWLQDTPILYDDIQDAKDNELQSIKKKKANKWRIQDDRASEFFSCKKKHEKWTIVTRNRALFCLHRLINLEQSYSAAGMNFFENFQSLNEDWSASILNATNQPNYLHCNPIYRQLYKSKDYINK